MLHYLIYFKLSVSALKQSFLYPPILTLWMFYVMIVRGAPIKKNNPLKKFSHSSTNFSQTFRLFVRVFAQHIVQIYRNN